MPGNVAILVLLGRYPVWSEAFLQRDVARLAANISRLRVAALARAESFSPQVYPLDVVFPPAIANCANPGAGCGEGHRRSVVFPPVAREVFSLTRHRREARWLLAFCRREGVGHIHAEFCDLPALMARAVARRAGISYSVGAHARDVFCCKYRLPSLLRDARFVTVCNAAAQNRLLELDALPPSRLHLVHHGLDAGQLPYRAPRERGKMLNLVFAGRFVAKKGGDMLLQAVADSAIRSRVRLRVIGAGPERGRWEDLARRLNLAPPELCWSETLSQDALRTVLADADAVVLPSCVAPDGDRDGIPNVMLEAMALGCPVVGTPVGGIPDVLTPETGWIANSATPAGVTAVLHEFLAAGLPTVAGRCAAARRVVERDFSPESATARRTQLFSEII